MNSSRTPVSTDFLLAKIRYAGWSVAVHNDYRQAGEAMTFWLFTHPDGRWAKGEARTDPDALIEAMKAIGPSVIQDRRDALAEADLKRLPPSAPSTRAWLGGTLVHHLAGGVAACGQIGVPSHWPPSNLWSGDWNETTCPACLEKRP